MDRWKNRLWDNIHKVRSCSLECFVTCLEYWIWNKSLSLRKDEKL